MNIPFFSKKTNSDEDIDVTEIERLVRDNIDISVTDAIPTKQIVEHIGLVATEQMIPKYNTKCMEQARLKATLNLAEKAARLGANGIVGFTLNFATHGAW